jgi:trimethylamine--corrinoid protein Co-methyltransferase
MTDRKETPLTADQPIFRPKLSFLAEGDQKALFDAALYVLEKTGMRLMHPGARQILCDAGCRLEKDDWVTVSSGQVHRALDSAPKHISIFDRQGRPAMELTGRNAYYGTGSDLIYSIESGQFQRHQCNIEDVAMAARVSDALPNIDFIMSFAHPHEVAPERAYLESFRVMVENSVKPIVNTAESRDDLARMWEMAKILRGSEQALRQKPYWIHYAEPISPLKHPFASVDKLLFCAETGSPVIYSPAPIAGSTAPMSIAGHVVQGLAESLFGLVIHQLAAPGAPFLMGMGAAVLDMVTGQCSYNAPEYLMAYMAMVEMSLYLDLPNWGYAGTSDSQIPDEQATFEAGLLSFMASTAGSNLNHDVGYLDFGRSGSLEMIVVLDELIDQIRRIQQGIPINADTLGLAAIDEAGRTGNFLTHPHTLKHLRATQWRPRLINRLGYEKWEERGRTTLMDRARARLKQIQAEHRPEALEAEKHSAIRELAARFKA